MGRGISGKVASLRNDVAALHGHVSDLEGEVVALRGDIARIQGSNRLSHGNGDQDRGRFHSSSWIDDALKSLFADDVGVPEVRPVRKTVDVDRTVKGEVVGGCGGIDGVRGGAGARGRVASRGEGKEV